MLPSGVVMTEKTMQDLIMDRIARPGWVSTRGILMDPSGQLAPEHHQAVENAMKDLARRGLVSLWKLFIKDQTIEMMAASRPDLNLAEELEQRGAWATAVRYELGE